MRIYVNFKHFGFKRAQFTPLHEVIMNQAILSHNDIQIANHYTVVMKPSESDFCVLPLLWNYYVDNDVVALAYEIYNEAKQAKKKLIIFGSGDYTANVPFHDAVIIQRSCFKSRDTINGNKVFAIPPFIDDYAELYCRNNLVIREKGILPVVGFCGQANGSLFDYTRRQLSISAKKILYKLKIIKWEPPNIEPTLFRNRVLNSFRNNSMIKTNFLLRTKYRAGYRIKNKDPFHPTRLEFIQNILDTDYTVCIRGGGNFSVRFYETLSLGRIPIFINTDCILPLDEIIDYKNYMILIDQHELPYMIEKIIDFHHSLTSTQFKDLQVECRNLWRTYFTKTGFFNHLPSALLSHGKFPSE